MSNKLGDVAGLQVTHYSLAMPKHSDLVGLGWALNIDALKTC